MTEPIPADIWLQLQKKLQVQTTQPSSSLIPESQNREQNKIVLSHTQFWGNLLHSSSNQNRL